MGTLVTIQVPSANTEAAIERAFGWFHYIEDRCTRFNPQSELMQLTTRIGVPVEVSAILFEAVQFAVMVAEESGGAFDPTVGHAMEQRGFDREYSTGEIVHSGIEPPSDVTYRDVLLAVEHRTITLRRPLLLDLGAVAKGLAVDTAARELQPFHDFMIDAGGDLYLGGSNAQGTAWSVGIRHPRQEGLLIDRLCASNQAVCTSGDYERRQHILDPRTGDPNTRAAAAIAVASATVVAPSAMLADALATAAFVLGPTEGITFLERLGVEGLIVTPTLERYETSGLRNAR